MPHNLVIVPPGKHMDIGTAAMTMTPDAARQTRPRLPAQGLRKSQILAATKLLDPGQKETLKLKAPAQPGDYEFVCTFPGHAVLMWGTLSVGK
jgi:azurin